NRGRVALNRIDGLAVQLCAESLIIVARKVGAEIFTRLTIGEIGLEQALDGIRHVFCSRTVAERARGTSVLANGPTNAELEGINQLAVLLDLLAFKTDIGDPVLAAAVGAAGDVQLDLLIEARKTVFHLADHPLCKSFSFGNGKLAELGAGAGNRAAPERGDVHLEAKRIEFDDQSRSLLVGHVDDDDVLHDGGTKLAIAILIGE